MRLQIEFWGFFKNKKLWNCLIILEFWQNILICFFFFLKWRLWSLINKQMLLDLSDKVYEKMAAGRKTLSSNRFASWPTITNILSKQKNKKWLKNDLSVLQFF